MMLDFATDGEPAAVWTTDLNGADEAFMDVTLGSVHLRVGQPGASAVSGIGTGALVWQAGPALAVAISEASASSSGVLCARGGEWLATARAIELGCGCSALPSVALALAGVGTVMATDAGEVLSELQANLAGYESAAEQSGSSIRIHDRLTPQSLMWDDCAALAALARDATGHAVVLCADVDYAETLHHMLLDAVCACLAPDTGAVTIFASAARCQRTLRLFLSRVASRGLTLVELTPSLEPLVQSTAGVDPASVVDGVRFFAARWVDEATATAERSRLAHNDSTSGAAQTRDSKDRSRRGAPIDAAVDVVLAELDELEAMLEQDDASPSGQKIPEAVVAASAAPAGAADDEWTLVGARSTADFLRRCARLRDRFFYPCNAKDRTVRRCAYELVASVEAQAAARRLCVRVLECEYAAGGTGWRVWPCALLLSCWLAQHLPLMRRSGAMRALELGCGLALPGLTAAALGAHVTLSDCLPRLLTTVAASVQANEQLQAFGSGGGSARAALLDWDDEAPPTSAEEFSTEQGIKRAQLESGGASSGVTEPPCARVQPDERFELILASDVLYSLTHARQLSAVVHARLAPGGTLAAMVPVRSEEHTRTLLNGLHALGMNVLLSSVDAAWVAAVVAPQRSTPTGPTLHGSPAGGTRLEPGATKLEEGDILFVQATCTGAGT